MIISFDNRPNHISEDIAQALTADGGGRGTQLIMTYQTIAGTVNAGAHPGSYNGQDAYNDMLVVDDENDLLHRGGRNLSNVRRKLLQRMRNKKRKGA